MYRCFMAERKTVSIAIDLGGTESAGVRRKTKTPSMPFPAGHQEIKQRLKRKGESEEYATEHAARIWNDAHPEEPVETSFDGENGGFLPNGKKTREVEEPKKVSRKSKKKKSEPDEEEAED